MDTTSDNPAALDPSKYDAPEPERDALTFHGFEILSLTEFLGGEPDTDVSIA